MVWPAQAWLWRVIALLAGFSLSPCRANAQDGRLRPEDRPWLGCWRIQVQDSLPGLQRELQVRLDSIPTYRGAPPAFYGFGFRGFWSGRDSTGLTWSAPSSDSLTLSTIGLGGYLWRFRHAKGGLVGLSYETYDVVDAQTLLGSATGRRAACP